MRTASIGLAHHLPPIRENLRNAVGGRVGFSVLRGDVAQRRHLEVPGEFAEVVQVHHLRYDPGTDDSDLVVAES